MVKQSIIGRNADIIESEQSMVALSPTTQPSKGGIFNGGFELGTKDTAVTADGIIGVNSGWYLDETAGQMSAELDTAVSHYGISSLKLEAIDTSGTGIAYNTSGVTLPLLSLEAIPLKISTKYRLIAWAKTNLVGASGVFADVIQYDSAAVVGTTVTTSKLSTTNDWTILTVFFTSDDDAAFGRIALHNDVAGTVNQAWFDDITLEEVVEDTTFTGTIPTPVRPTIVGVTSTDNIDVSKVGATDGWQGWWAQQFAPTKNKLTSIQALLGKVGAPTSTTVLTVAIETDNANAPSGTILASTTTTFANLVNGLNTFNVPCLLTPGTKYWATFKSDASWTTFNGVQFYYTIAAQTDYYTTSAGEYPWSWSAGATDSVISLITNYAKPTENATIVCNGEKISLSTNEDGLLSGAIIDLDKGKYLYTNGFNSVSLLSDIYSAGVGGGTTAPDAVNGWDWTSTLEALQSASGATARNIILKVNTLLPIKSLKITPTIFNNNTLTGLTEISTDGTNFTTLWTLAASAAAQTQVIYTEIPKGLSTFYLRLSKDAANQYIRFDNLIIEADLDTASVPSIILQPLATPVQYSDNIYIPATADRVYLQNTKYANDRGVVVPHLEFCATAVPIKAFPLKVDNTGETIGSYYNSVKFITTECSGSPTIGTGAQDAATGNWCIRNGEYIGITGTANTAIKLTYQIGKETAPAAAVTAFTNLTMNRLYLSSNGVANSATKDPSHQFSFYLGMLKQGVQKVVEGMQRIINNMPTDHGALTGLTDDDHVRYFDKDCTKPLTGNFLGRDVDTDHLILTGGATDTSGGGAFIHLYGKDSASVGYMYLCTPNAAGTGYNVGITIEGNTNTPTIGMNSHRVKDVGAPTTDGDAATKNYVDTRSQTYAGNPTNNLVPTAINYLCIDTTNHDLYIATTTLSSGWRIFTRAA